MIITTEMIRQYLPASVAVKKYENKVNSDADVWIGTLPNPYKIDGEEKMTAFAISISGFERQKHLTDSELNEFLKNRVNVAYNQAIRYDQTLKKDSP